MLKKLILASSGLQNIWVTPVNARERFRSNVQNRNSQNSVI